MSEWNRRRLWSQHDARQSVHARVRALLAVLALGATIIALSTMAVACIELYYLEDARHVPATAASPTCTHDADCALLPSLFTCCGECAPVPPFEAVTTRQLAALRADVDADCAPATRLCDPPACSALPPTCEARAVCVAGTCRADATPTCLYRHTP